MGEEYQNVGAIDSDFEKCKIKHLEPFKDYYKEDEYRFIMYEGKPVIDVESLEPMERFEAKYIKPESILKKS